MNEEEAVENYKVGERGRKEKGCNTSRVEKLLVHGCKQREGNRSERDIKITIGKGKRKEGSSERAHAKKEEGAAVE